MRMGVSNCAVEIQSESADGHIISRANKLPADGRHGLPDTRGVL